MNQPIIAPCSLPQFKMKLGGDFARLKQSGISCIHFSWQRSDFRNIGTVSFKVDMKLSTKKFINTLRKQFRSSITNRIPITIKEVNYQNELVAKYKINSIIKSISFPPMDYNEDNSYMSVEFAIESFKKFDYENQ